VGHAEVRQVAKRREALNHPHPHHRKAFNYHQPTRGNAFNRQLTARSSISGTVQWRSAGLKLQTTTVVCNDALSPFVVFLGEDAGDAELASYHRVPSSTNTIPDDLSGPRPHLVYRGVHLPPGRWYHMSSRAGDAFLSSLIARSQQVNQLEILAAICVYFSLRQLLAGRKVLHFVDNSSALGALVRGYSSSPDSARMVHAFWAIVLAARIDVWFEYVRSSANIADWPSRGHVRVLCDAFRSTPVAVIIPPLVSWREAYESALAGVVKHGRRSTRPRSRGAKRPLSSP